MMGPLKKTRIDLLAAAKEMERRAAYKKCAGLIEKTWATQSALTDLEYAKARLLALSELVKERQIETAVEQDKATAGISSSLFMAAIIFYCRGTDTGSNHRKRVPIADRYTPEQKIVHREIMKLRNDALAHYGPGTSGRPTGYWNEDAFYLEYEGEKQIFNAQSKRANYFPEHSNSLFALTSLAIETCNTLAAEASKDLSTELVTLSEKDLDFRKLLSRHIAKEAFFRDGLSGKSISFGPGYKGPF
jgi:hypothetical protein